MRQLRYREQRDDPHLPLGNVPIRTEEPRPLMPNPAAPEKLLNICECPKRREKNEPIARKPAIDRTGSFPPHPCVHIDQGEVRHAVDDDVGNRKRIIGIEKDDAGISTNGGRRDNDVFPDIQKAGGEIKIDRFEKVCREGEDVDREKNVFNDGGQSEKVVLEKPIEVPRQARHPKGERVKGREINGRRIYRPGPTLALARLSPVKRDPAVLLSYEMKDRDDRQSFPEDEFAFRVKRDSDRIAENRDKCVKPEAAFEFFGVKIDAEARRPNVSDIDQQDRRYPRPLRRCLVEYPKLPTNRKQQKRHDRTAEKDREVNAA